MASTELFTVWSLEHETHVKVFGVVDNQFLVRAKGGWAWVNHKHFSTSGATQVFDYKDAIHYNGQRP